MPLGSFFTGMIAGGALVYGSLTYHVLNTAQGMTFIPKLQPSFEDIYLDVRQFGISDWSRHRAVAAAVVKANKQEIFTQHTADTVSQHVGDLVRELNGLKPSTP